MYNTTYKELKYNTNTAFLNNVLDKANFVCFVQIRSFNSGDYTNFKKYLTSLKLNIYVSKKTELYQKINFLFSKKTNSKKFIKGHLAIVYSIDPDLIGQKEMVAFFDFVAKNSNLVPLYAYIFKRFLTIEILMNIVKTSLGDKHYFLLSLLIFNNSNILSLFLAKKLL